MYIMFSTPLIASSSGVATVSAITLGLAPGYTAVTTTEGGTTSGYSLIGSIGIEIRPAAKITIDNTAAKIGLSMKNLEKSMGIPGEFAETTFCSLLCKEEGWGGVALN